MKKLIALMLMPFVLVACGSTNSASDESQEGSAEVTVTDNRDAETVNEETANSGNVTDEDFEVKEYLYETSFGTTYCYLIVKNNSDTDVEISANGTAQDAGGNTLGAGSASIDILGAGETSICYFYFDDVSGIDHVDYQLNYGTDSYYAPVIRNISMEQTMNDSNVVVTATNNGDKPAEFVEAYALFFDVDNNLIDSESTYLTDNDSEIKPGATISEQLTTYNPYDHAEVYLTGRAEK